MADSNSQPPRCSCGFYGSAQTMGLCSKCYREQKGSSSVASCGEQQQRTPSTGSTSTSSITESDHTASATEVLSQALTQVQTARTTTNCPAPVSQQQSQDLTTSASNALASCSSPTASNNTQSDEKALSTSLPKGTKRKLDETESNEQEPDPPVKQNKKRCYKCRCKLELHVRAVGKCKCGYIFCPLHRLPEQHECNYKHKEIGREEARGKMVSPKKHLGTSVKRIDHDS